MRRNLETAHISIMDREVIGTLWKGPYILLYIVFHSFVFNAKTFLLHCFLGWPCFVQFDSVGVSTLKYLPTITLNFCLHSTYNIKSNALVNEPALLHATADGRYESS